ncbi:BREX-2 system phosphatase PglZ [Pseudonocardia xishanensis]|uniref:BREX-2 system phosphatase PglZ n=1 Tax=Pseudonocardia xishanensis TaxID=630995 RepID=A0ABP8RCV7_9PSEU
MTATDTATAGERAILGRIRTQLGKLAPTCRALGIRTAEEPRWRGEPTAVIEGRRLRIAPCSSVLGVLDALASAADDEITVLLTNLAERDLGDAVLAKLHKGRLLEADRYTLVRDLLGARSLDPRISKDVWLVDALITLANAERIPSLTGTTLSRRRAVSLVVQARLGADPEQADLPALVSAFDDTLVRAEWRGLSEAERRGLVGELVNSHGPGVGAVAALAETRDDLLAELLVIQAVTDAPEDHKRAIATFAVVQHRFEQPRPTRSALAEAGAAAVASVDAAPEARLAQQIRVADAKLEELSATELAEHSPVLGRGFTERLARAAQFQTKESFAALEGHRSARAERHRVERVRAAARLERWLVGKPATGVDTVAAGLSRHMAEIAWVDRALTQVRAGDPDPRVATVLASAATRAGGVRADLDRAFAAQLARLDRTPSSVLAVETFLEKVVAPLGAQTRVLLVVVDGMSGAVATDLAEELTARRTGWTEIVRSESPGREALVAALPTETAYSRTSLLCARLTTGDQAKEKATFPGHRFWPANGAALFHKAAVAGADGADLGFDLDQAVGEEGPAVTAVVLNTVDDSLAKGRQSRDPRWRPDDVAGLSALLTRAVGAGRIVLLVSDHGHVLEHGSVLRSAAGASARWRPESGVVGADEVLVTGERVLTAERRAILAATEEVRFGAKAHGYHGGATLAEAVIPLVALLPPGMEAPTGWTATSIAPPTWWDDLPEPVVVGPPDPPRRKPGKRKPEPQGDGLFDLTPAPVAATRGSRLVGSPTFVEALSELPANRVPAAEVFRDVVDLLVASGGRAALTGLASAGGVAGRNPRALVSVLRRVLNRDGYPVLELVDGGRAVKLDIALLDEQFPDKRS